MSKIVVYGANGFIGKHLVRALAQVESDEIIAFDRFSKYTDSNTQPFADLENVTPIYGDFLNRDDIARALPGADFVFHLVTSTNPAASSNDPFIDIDTNVRSSIELLSLCVEHSVKKVIFPSSGGAVYGDVATEKISERLAPQPRSPYGIGKLTIEHYLRYFKATHGLNYIVYRIGNPYGPGQNIFGKQGVIPIFMHKFLVKEPITIFGDGSMVRDYIYIDDLIKMILRSYKARNQFTEYNLGTGIGETVNDIVNSIEDCTGYCVEKNYSDVPATFVQKSLLNIERYDQEFGPIEFTSLSDGLKGTWDYVKKLK